MRLLVTNLDGLVLMVAAVAVGRPPLPLPMENKDPVRPLLLVTNPSRPLLVMDLARPVHGLSAAMAVGPLLMVGGGNRCTPLISLLSSSIYFSTA